MLESGIALASMRSKSSSLKNTREGSLMKFPDSERNGIGSVVTYSGRYTLLTILLVALTFPFLTACKTSAALVRLDPRLLETYEVPDHVDTWRDLLAREIELDMALDSCNDNINGIRAAMEGGNLRLIAP
jgi:hypothetical protein